MNAIIITDATKDSDYGFDNADSYKLTNVSHCIYKALRPLKHTTIALSLIKLLQDLK